MDPIAWLIGQLNSGALGMPPGFWYLPLNTPGSNVFQITAAYETPFGVIPANTSIVVWLNGSGTAGYANPGVYMPPAVPPNRLSPIPGTTRPVVGPPQNPSSYQPGIRPPSVPQVAPGQQGVLGSGGTTPPGLPGNPSAPTTIDPRTTIIPRDPPGPPVPNPGGPSGPSGRGGQGAPRGPAGRQPPGTGGRIGPGPLPRFGPPISLMLPPPVWSEPGAPPPPQRHNFGGLPTTVVVGNALNEIFYGIPQIVTGPTSYTATVTITGGIPPIQGSGVTVIFPVYFDSGSAPATYSGMGNNVQNGAVGAANIVGYNPANGIIQMLIVLVAVYGTRTTRNYTTVANGATLKMVDYTVTVSIG